MINGSASRVCILLVLAPLVGCEAKKPAKTAMTMYSSTEGNFRALMPADPVEKTRERVLPNGTLSAHYVSAGSADKLQFGVCWLEWTTIVKPAATISTTLEATATELITSLGGTELSRTKIELDGHPGREVRFQVSAGADKPRMLGRFRFYSIGNRIYEVMIYAPESFADPTVSKEFFESFALITPVDVAPEPE